jgi:hypothetical protein
MAHDITSPLAQAIRAIFDRPFEVGPVLRHFLESTFSISTPDDFRAFIADGDPDELDLFLELLVSPDNRIQGSLEPMLENGCLSEADERAVTEQMVASVKTVRIRFKEDGLLEETPLTDDILRRFMEKLNLRYTLPEPLTRRMTTALPEPLARATGVALRQQSLPIGNNSLDFFLRFIAEFGGYEDDYLPYLECALSVMSAHSGDPDVRDLLANTLSSCRRHLEQITAGEEMLRKGTMETLMHQGIRVASVPPDVLREKIAMLRQILIRVFGWTDPDRSAPAEIDLGDHHGPGSMEAVIKLLS